MFQLFTSEEEVITYLKKHPNAKLSVKGNSVIINEGNRVNIIINKRSAKVVKKVMSKIVYDIAMTCPEVQAYKKQMSNKNFANTSLILWSAAAAVHIAMAIISVFKLRNIHLSLISSLNLALSIAGAIFAKTSAEQAERNIAMIEEAVERRKAEAAQKAWAEEDIFNLNGDNANKPSNEYDDFDSLIQIIEAYIENQDNQNNKEE